MSFAAGQSDSASQPATLQHFSPSISILLKRKLPVWSRRDLKVETSTSKQESWKTLVIVFMCLIFKVRLTSDKQSDLSQSWVQKQGCQSFCLTKDLSSATNREFVLVRWYCIGMLVRLVAKCFHTPCEFRGNNLPIYYKEKLTMLHYLLYLRQQKETENIMWMNDSTTFTLKLQYDLQ